MSIQSIPIHPVRPQKEPLRARFLDLLYASALDTSLVWETAQALCAVVSGDRAFLYAAERCNGPRFSSRLHCDASGDALERGEEDASLARIREEIDVIATSTGDRVFSGPGGAAAASCEEIRPQRFLALLVGSGERSFGFIVVRAGNFDEQHKSDAWSLLADVRRAFDLRLRTNQASLAFTPGARLFHDGEIGSVLTSDSRIEGINPAAAAMIQRGGPIQQRGQTLLFEGAKAQAAFERVSNANDPQARAAFVMPAKTGGEIWLIQLTKLCLTDPWLVSDENRVLVLITPFNAISRTRASAIDGIIGLTATERSIFAALVDGQELPALARQMGRSIKTLRWHLRNVFAKMRVNSQNDLARIGSLLLPI
jgi:DNA-binding CsgD family transcriptional regulator